MRLSPDTRERHLVASRLLAGAATIVDVGGRPGGLAVPGAAVTVVNAEPPADVLADAAALPFADGAFEAAASLDVVEHVPPGRRAAHVAELRRVARRVVLCCPLGGGGHEELEDALRAEFPGHRWLEEHARHGLPGLEELRALEPDELWFHGSASRAAARFRAQGRARRGRPFRALAHALARPDLELRTGAAGANRAFLVWRRDA